MRLKTIGGSLRSADDLVLAPSPSCGNCRHRIEAGPGQVCKAFGTYCSIALMKLSGDCPKWEPEPERRSALRWIYDALFRMT